MSDLGAERNIQLDAGDVEGKVELVVEGTIPRIVGNILCQWCEKND